MKSLFLLSLMIFCVSCGAHKKTLGSLNNEMKNTSNLNDQSLIIDEKLFGEVNFYQKHYSLFQKHLGEPNEILYRGMIKGKPYGWTSEKGIHGKILQKNHPLYDQLYMVFKYRINDFSFELLFYKEKLQFYRDEYFSGDCYCFISFSSKKRIEVSAPLE